MLILEENFRRHLYSSYITIILIYYFYNNILSTIIYNKTLHVYFFVQ